VPPQTRLPKAVGSHSIKVAKTGVRKNDSCRQSVEQADFVRFESKLAYFGLGVGFGTCKCPIDRLEFAESFSNSDGDFAGVSRSSHKRDAGRTSCCNADAPAQAKDWIEHGASRSR
jgi:hypothetical protein